MIKNILILFVVSLLLAEGEFNQSCHPDELNLIDSSEPYNLFKEDKCYSSEFIDSKPIIDGVLDEDLWGGFDQTNINNYIHSFIQEEPDNMERPRLKTFVKILHDHEYIYSCKII